MTGSDFSEEQLFKNIPGEIQEKLITTLLEEPFEEAKIDEFVKKIDYLIQDAQWDDLLKKGHFHFEEAFLERIKFKINDSNLLAFIRKICVIDRVTYYTSPPCT